MGLVMSTVIILADIFKEALWEGDATLISASMAKD